ncbi:MAG: TlpA family protein disulfide reductase [Winogradskyella sp.]|uniref:TlpA disulfide reductase family protein n=1 Tax=Winogradskyella sp. TaxID=1883156 RepID=UPI0025F91A63|nr:TlpA disulfide reductase family protein [Winogradskyella sp.]NRB61075.1 TlpA family protein disulfide reductase [Winogradskyella sp.]
MRRILLLLSLLLFSCKNDVSETIQETNLAKEIDKKTGIVDVSDIELEIYDYDGLEPIINKKDNKIHVVNFWATWCGPCVKELPYFEDMNKKYKADNVEVLLVSLDFPNKYESQLKPFIKKYDLKSKVVAFDDTNQNRWIPAINNDWSGALPATIIYNKSKRKFYEQSFTKEELEKEIQQFLN